MKSDLSVTNWEIVGEPRTETSYNDKTIAFARTYREILYAQAADVMRGQPGRLTTHDASSKTGPDMTVANPSVNAPCRLNDTGCLDLIASRPPCRNGTVLQ